MGFVPIYAGASSRIRPLKIQRKSEFPGYRFLLKYGNFSKRISAE